MDPWIHGSMDPWIHGSAAGAAARAAAGAAAGAAASAAAVGILSCAFKGGGAGDAPSLYLRNKDIQAAPAAALAAAPATDPWIHGSISFIMNHIFYFEMKVIMIHTLKANNGSSPTHLKVCILPLKVEDAEANLKASILKLEDAEAFLRMLKYF